MINDTLTAPVVSPPMAEFAAAVLIRIGLAMILLPLTAGDIRPSGAAPLDKQGKMSHDTGEKSSTPLLQGGAM